LGEETLDRTLWRTLQDAMDLLQDRLRDGGGPFLWKSRQTDISLERCSSAGYL